MFKKEYFVVDWLMCLLFDFWFEYVVFDVLYFIDVCDVFVVEFVEQDKIEFVVQEFVVIFVCVLKLFREDFWCWLSGLYQVCGVCNFVVVCVLWEVWEMYVQQQDVFFGWFVFDCLFVVVVMVNLIFKQVLVGVKEFQGCVSCMQFDCWWQVIVDGCVVENLFCECVLSDIFFLLCVWVDCNLEVDVWLKVVWFVVEVVVEELGMLMENLFMFEYLCCIVWDLLGEMVEEIVDVLIVFGVWLWQIEQIVQKIVVVFVEVV